MRMLRRVACVAVVVWVAGCSSDSNVQSDGNIGNIGDGNQQADTQSVSLVPPTWVGSKVHFQAEGQIAGKAVDCLLEGDVLKELDAYKVLRKYCVTDVVDENTWKDGYIYKFEINLDNAAAAECWPGQDKVEFDFAGHDFQRDAAGASTDIISASAGADTSGAVLKLVVENQSATTIAFDSAAEAGTFELKQWSGDVGTNGFVLDSNTGLVGGVFKARWSGGDELSVSFAAPAGENRIRLDGTECPDGE